MAERFEPKILCFCCQWCSYAAADLAGSMRMQYPTNVHILKVPCTGRVDITHMLQAFEVGADGVFLSGCLAGRLPLRGRQLLCYDQGETRQTNPEGHRHRPGQNGDVLQFLGHGAAVRAMLHRFHRAHPAVGTAAQKEGSFRRFPCKPLRRGYKQQTAVLLRYLMGETT